ncbi:MAG: histidine phosphatase family protein [Chloroflexota bacterium]
MSTLFLVRHGQASFQSDDYDQLSPLGETQARLLGEHWVRLNRTFDRVYIGSLRRHQQTEAAVAAVYQSQGLPWPTAEVMSEFNEHLGPEVMQHVLATAEQQSEEVQAILTPLKDNPTPSLRTYLRAFQEILRLWVQEGLQTGNLQSWGEFRNNVETGLKQIMRQDGEGKRVAIFSSGGPAIVATGFALNLSHEQVLELMWGVYNASYAEFRFSEDRFSLKAFNSHSHFQEIDLLTYV